MIRANNGAPGPEQFPADVVQLAGIIERDSSIRLAFIPLGGWDTHVNQGAAEGQLANHLKPLKPLADGLAEFAQRLGRAYDDTVVLVISEFGRTVRENGNGGTDHGHGNVMWVIGGRVRRRRIYGDWRGLSPGELYQERDLAVTTDFREPIAQVLRAHMRVSAAQIEKIFPGKPPDTGHVRTLFRA